MHGLGRDDHDVAGLNGELFVAGGEDGRSLLDDKRLGVGVEVEVGALAAVVLDDEDRGVDLVAALEQGGGVAQPEVFDWRDRCDGPQAIGSDHGAGGAGG